MYKAFSKICETMLLAFMAYAFSFQTSQPFNTGAFWMQMVLASLLFWCAGIYFSKLASNLQRATDIACIRVLTLAIASFASRKYIETGYRERGAFKQSELHLRCESIASQEMIMKAILHMVSDKRLVAHLGDEVMFCLPDSEQANLIATFDLESKWREKEDSKMLDHPLVSEISRLRKTGELACH